MEPIQTALYDNQERVQEYAIEHTEKIAEWFNKEFGKLEAILKEKLADLESLATDRTKAEQRAEEARKNKEWLDNIQKKIEYILEI